MFERRHGKRYGLISRGMVLTGALLALFGGLSAWAQSSGHRTSTPPNATQANATAPDVRVEFLGAESGYAVGMQSVTLLCVVRNVGSAPLPDRTLRLRCYAVTGLDYTTGETMPVVPALGPNQALAYRWRLAPSNATGPLTAAVLMEPVTPTSAAAPEMPSSPGGGLHGTAHGGSDSATTGAQPPPPAEPAPLPAPRAVVTTVPRLAAPLRPGGDAIRPAAGPLASAGETSAWIGNDRMGARIVASELRQPVLLLCGKEGAGWRGLAVGSPMASVRSGEDGQVAWWETFRWRAARVRIEKDLATLTLLGNVGTRWQAEMVFVARRDTAALSGRLRLKPLRVMRLYSVLLPRLQADNSRAAASFRADGSAQPLSNAEPLLPETARVIAGRANGITFGLTWPSTGPDPGWKWSRLPAGDANVAPLPGAQWDDARGSLILPGTAVEIPFRLFAFGPSDSLHAALRFVLP
jgi:hypothetical protein